MSTKDCQRFLYSILTRVKRVSIYQINGFQVSNTREMRPQTQGYRNRYDNNDHGH